MNNHPTFFHRAKANRRAQTRVRLSANHHFGVHSPVVNEAAYWPRTQMAAAEMYALKATQTSTGDCPFRHTHSRTDAARNRDPVRMAIPRPLARQGSCVRFSAFL